MSDFSRSDRQPGRWRWLPGTLISLALIAALLYFVDLKRFLEAFRTANLWLLGGFFLVSLLWLTVRAVVWRTLLRGRAAYLDTFLTLCEGYLLNNVLPFRLGEVGRAFLLGRKASLGFVDVFSTVIVERVVDLAFSAAIFLSAIPFVAGAAGAETAALTVAGLIMLGLTALYLLARNQQSALALFDRLTARRPRLQNFKTSFLAPLFSGLAILTDAGLFLRFLFWMTLNWLLAIGQFYLLILAFFPQAMPLWSLFGLGAVAFGNAIPSMPGAIGTFEGALAGALTLLSGNESAALAAALAAHLGNYLASGLIGLYALSREGETLMGVYRQLRERKSEVQ